MKVTEAALCVVVLAAVGCVNNAPPPARVGIPAASNRENAHERDYDKPGRGDSRGDVRGEVRGELPRQTPAEGTPEPRP
jgi:hypothetical protein